MTDNQVGGKLPPRKNPEQSRETNTIWDTPNIRTAAARRRWLQKHVIVHRSCLHALGVGQDGDPEKTVMDLAYLDFWSARKGHAPARLWNEHLGSVDVRRLRRYLPRYPRALRSMVEEQL